MKRPVAKVTRARKPRKIVQFLQKDTCATCRKVRNRMRRQGYHLQFRDIWKEPLSATELSKLIGSGDHTQFLNPRSETYRRKNMKEEPPSRREAISLMAKEPSLIRRPIVVAGGRVVVAFDDKGRVTL